MPAEGEVRVNRLDPSRRAVFRGGQWYEEGGGASARPAGKATGHLPATVQKFEEEDMAAINTASGINSRLGPTRQRLDNGQLNLGPIANLVSEGRNWAGMSDQNSRKYASFRADLEKMRNDSLRLNKGVQTEGDAQRAWNEVFKNMNDEKLVSQRLSEIEQINNEAIRFRETALNTRRRGFGVPELDTSSLKAGNPLAAAGQPQTRMRSTRQMGAEAATRQRPGANELSEARVAIARGAPRDAVIARLRQAGIDPAGL